MWENATEGARSRQTRSLLGFDHAVMCLAWGLFLGSTSLCLRSAKILGEILRVKYG